MPKIEDDPAIELLSLLGGRSIRLQGDNSHEWDVDMEGELQSSVPIWIRQYQPTLVPHTSFAHPGIFDTISRELALTAARQAYFNHGDVINSVYRSIQRRAVLAGARHQEEAAPQPDPAAGARDGYSAELHRLQEKVQFLEAQLESQRLHLQLFRLGAGSLFIAVLSVAIWLLTGIGIPFHPIFAMGVIPAAIGVIVMAFLVRPSKKPKRVTGAAKSME